MSITQVVFVTGVSSGIGRATASQFAQRGCKVFGSVRNLKKTEPIPGVELVEMDVRDAASVQRAVEGLSETLDHEVRGFGVRVVLVEPSYTKTNLDLNAPQAAKPVSAYDAQRDLVSQAIVRSVQKAPGPDSVATTIVDAALGPWKMRRTPKGEASLLSKLRRFMPAGPVDASLRKTFGLA